MHAPHIEMRNITKRFGNVPANGGVDFVVNQGEIHALVGENGAGKTTLMRILYGLCQPDGGEILIQDRPVKIRSPQTAIAMGIGMVHQQFTLLDALSVMENVILGREPGSSVWVDSSAARQRLQQLQKQFGFHLDLDAEAGRLGVEERQQVEILKTIYRGANILILDEPTAVLAPGTIEALFELLRKMKSEGKTIIFISHKLREVMSIADSITVMRSGKVVGSVDARETSTEELASMMFGHRVARVNAALLVHGTPPPSPLPVNGEGEIEERAIPLHVYGEGEQGGGVGQERGDRGEEILRVTELETGADNSSQHLRRLTFSVMRGEIFGVAGVEGNGQTDLVQCLMGLRRPTRGSIEFAGQDVTGWRPDQAREKGVVCLPADRLRDGLIADMSVAENLVLGPHRFSGRFPGFVLRTGDVNHAAERLLREFDIKCSSVTSSLATLSGGNQQKVLLARELFVRPLLAIMVHPTQGVDAALAAYVHDKLMELRSSGCGIILFSMDMDELLTLCDRVGVMFEGRFVDIMDRSDATEQKLGMLMTGAAV